MEMARVGASEGLQQGGGYVPTYHEMARVRASEGLQQGRVRVRVKVRVRVRVKVRVRVRVKIRVSKFLSDDHLGLGSGLGEKFL